MIGSMIDDNSVIERILSGDREQFRTLVDRHRKVLLNYIWRMIRHTDDVEEIGQEVFLQAYRNLGKFEPGRGVPFVAWLLIIARNHCLNHIKNRDHQSRYQQLAWQEEQSSEDTPDELLHRKQQAESLNDTLQQMPPEFRETFILREVNGLPVNTVADIQNIAIGTVKSRLNRARKYLQEVWDQHE